MFRLKLTYILPLFLILVFLLMFGPNVWGTQISPGFDLFATVAESTFVDLGPIGTVGLKGDPLNGLGNTDTIVERGTGISPLNVGDIGTIDIELIALSLVSSKAVAIGGLNFDLKVESGRLLNDPMSPFFRNTSIPSSPVGSMDVDHNQPNGGLFDSALPVTALITFTQVGNPANSFTQPFDDILTTPTSGMWSHDPGPGDAHTSTFPSSDFFAGVDPVTSEKVQTLEESLTANHLVVPAMVPEPSTFLMLAIGFIGIVGYKRKRNAVEVHQ